MDDPCRSVKITKTKERFWTKRNRLSYKLLAREKRQALMIMVENKYCDGCPILDKDFSVRSASLCVIFIFRGGVGWGGCLLQTPSAAR